MKALRRILTVVAAASVPLVGSAQTPPAAAPAPMVQLYGTLNVNLQYIQAKGATTATANVSPRFGVSIDSSNIGVRGTADLGGGMKAVYQCETQADVSGDDTRALCNRNSRIGLSGDWGTLFFGNWDMPLKAATYGTKADDPFGSTDVFGFNGVMGSPGYGVRSSALGAAATASASFDERAANSVAYWSPKFAGLGLKLHVGTDEFRTVQGQVDPMILGAALNFDLEGLSVVLAGEYHEDYYGIRTASGANAGTTASKDLAWRLSAGYELPLGGDTALTLMGMFENLSYKQDNATVAAAGNVGFKSYSRPAWLVGAKFRMAEHEFKARYSQALKPSITVAPTAAAANEDQLGATNIALGYGYNFTKTTQVFLFYTMIKNQDRARYTFGVSGGATAVVGTNTAAGSDPTAYGLGIRQAF